MLCHKRCWCVQVSSAGGRKQPGWWYGRSQSPRRFWAGDIRHCHEERAPGTPGPHREQSRHRQRCEETCELWEWHSIVSGVSYWSADITPASPHPAGLKTRTVNADILMDILNTQQSLITHNNKYTYVGISGQEFGKNSKASDFSVRNCQDPGQLDPNEIRHQLWTKPGKFPVRVSFLRSLHCLATLETWS